MTAATTLALTASPVESLAMLMRALNGRSCDSAKRHVARGRSG